MTDDIDRIHEKLERIEQRQIDALGTLAVLKEQVVGNGGPGISQRLTSIETVEQREHGAIRVLLIIIPIAVGIGGLILKVVIG